MVFRREDSNTTLDLLHPLLLLRLDCQQVLLLTSFARDCQHITFDSVCYQIFDFELHIARRYFDIRSDLDLYILELHILLIEPSYQPWSHWQ